MNLNSLARRLQTALAQRGVYCAINHRQWYNEHTKKMATKFILKVQGEKKAAYEGYKMDEVVKALAGMLKETEGTK